MLEHRRVRQEQDVDGGDRVLRLCKADATRQRESAQHRR
jgi:hypothetical protein